MDENIQKQEEILRREYFPYVHKIGRLFCILLFFANVLPLILIYLFYGIAPDARAALTGLGMAAMILLPFYLTEGWMYFSVLGIAGNYMQWAGNTSNCRIPCASVAQEVVGVKEGTPEGEIIANIAVGTSIVVNALFVLAGALLGNVLMAIVPPSVKAAFNLALPAIFGAIYAQFTLRGPQYAAFVMALALLLQYLKVLPNWGVLLVLMVVSLGTSLLAYRRYGKYYIRK